MGRDPQFENPLKRKLPLIVVFETASRTHAHSDLPCPPHSAPPAGRASARTGKALGDLPWEPLLAGDQGLSVMMVREGGDAGREGIIDEGILYPTCMRTERTNYSFQSSFLHTYFSFSFMVFVLWIKIRANEMR